MVPPSWRQVLNGMVTVVKMFLSALGGPGFWIGFTLASFFECSIESVQPWLLGLWATQYETHKSEDVNVPLYVSAHRSNSSSSNDALTLDYPHPKQLPRRLRRTRYAHGARLRLCPNRAHTGRSEGVEVAAQEAH